jgi:hypothetical protein
MGLINIDNYTTSINFSCIFKRFNYTFLVFVFFTSFLGKYKKYCLVTLFFIIERKDEPLWVFGLQKSKQIISGLQ